MNNTYSLNANDKTYDSEYEHMIEERLNKLDQLAKDEFYHIRTLRKDSLLPDRELDMLTLEALEKSYKHHKEKNY